MDSTFPSVLIISDVRLYGEGLAAFLSEDKRLGKAKACADVGAVLQTLSVEHFNLVCVDHGMETAPWLTQQLIARKFNVILLCMRQDTSAIADFLEAGIAGYVGKDASLEDLVRVVESAAKQEILCSREVACTLHRRIDRFTADRGASPDNRLTQREQEISRLLKLGWSNKRIARHLNITVSTTKNHVHHILEQLGVGSRAEAASMLLRSLGEISAPGP